MENYNFPWGSNRESVDWRSWAPREIVILHGAQIESRVHAKKKQAVVASRKTAEAKKIASVESLEHVGQRRG